MAERDEFSPTVKRILAERAAYFCSNPDCRELTIRPHSDPKKTTTTGIAAHICAAAQGGPRYDTNQSPEERGAIGNGVWLCHSCSDRVDKDEKKYTATMLRSWRSQHEAWVAGESILPALPALEVETLHGLIFPSEGGAVTGQDVSNFRDHVVKLHVTSRHELLQMSIRMQFPEAVVGVTWLSRPPGLGVDLRPERPPMIAFASGGGSVTGGFGRYPTPNILLDVDRLLPQRNLEFALRTVQNVAGSIPRDVLSKIGSEGALWTYATGSFLYEHRGHFFERRFIVPFKEVGERVYASLPSEEDDGHRSLIHSMLMG